MSSDGNKEVAIHFQGRKICGMGVTWPSSLPLKHQLFVENTNI
jgi:hypothetical protein